MIIDEFAEFSFARGGAACHRHCMLSYIQICIQRLYPDT